MTMTTEWNLSAEALAEYTAEDGAVFQQVLETVHWRVTATDDATGESTTIYGSQGIPKPTDASTYIDLSVLLEMPDEEKRQTVLGWAELITPGLVAEKEQAVKDKLQAKLDEPVRSSVGIL